MSSTKIITIGSIPTNRGMYSDKETYYMQNMICYKGSIFSANTNNFSGLPPLTVDSETGMVTFTNKSYWTCIVDNVDLYNRSIQFGDMSDKIKELTEQLEILKSIIRYRIEFVSDLNAGFGKGESHTLQCKLMFGDIDKSDKVTVWTIERNTGNSVADDVWKQKQKVKNFNGEIILVWDDNESDLGDDAITTFTVTAFGSDNAPIVGSSIKVTK